MRLQRVLCCVFFHSFCIYFEEELDEDEDEDDDDDDDDLEADTFLLQQNGKHSHMNSSYVPAGISQLS